MTNSQGPIRRGRWKRFLVVFFVTGALLFVCLTIAVYYVQGSIEARIGEALESGGVPVTYDTLDVNVLGRNVQVRTLKANSRDGSMSVSVDSIVVQVVTLPLMGRPLVLDIAVDRPTVAFREATSAPATQPASKVPNIPDMDIVVRSLQVTDGVVLASDPRMGDILAGESVEAKVNGQFHLSHLGSDGASGESNAASGRLELEVLCGELAPADAVVAFELTTDGAMRFVRWSTLSLEAPSLDARWKSSGYVGVGKEAGGGHIDMWGDVRVDKLAEYISRDVAAGLGGLPEPLSVSGNSSLSVEVSREEGRAWELDNAMLTLPSIGIEAGAGEVLLTGTVRATPDEISTSGLTVNSAYGNVTLWGRARKEADRTRAEVTVAIPRLDLEGLLAKGPKEEVGTESTDSAARTESTAETPAGAEEAATVDDSQKHLDPIRRAMQSVDVDARIIVGDLVHPEFRMEAANVNAQLEAGKLTFRKLQGRLFRGTFRLDGTAIDFNQRPAECHAVFSVKGMRAEPALERFVTMLFSELHFTGEFSAEGEIYVDMYGSEDDVTRLATAESMNGSGYWETTRGFLRGKSAPPYVAALIPSVNLSDFLFNRMTAEFVVMNGTTISKMFFDADGADLEIAGQASPDGSYRYESTVNFVRALGLKAPKDDSGSVGRVRLLVFSGWKDRAGVPHDEVVRYAAEEDLLLGLKKFVWGPARTVLSPAWLIEIFPKSKDM